MSASACPSCGAELPEAARFCPACGTPVPEPEPTPPEPPAPAEPEPDPEPKPADPEAGRSGAVPPFALLVLGFAALGASVGLFAAGRWPYALILLGVAILAFAVLLEPTIHRSGSADRNRPTRTTTPARSRFSAAREIRRARSDEAAEGRRVQAELALLESERGSAVRTLGEAVAAGDESAEQAARALIRGLDERKEALELAWRERLDETAERIHRARVPDDQAPPAPDPGASPEP
jgi:zinc-ribbon domain